MTVPQISIRSRHRGQSVVEALLIGPIIAVILLIATRVGQYFYTFSVSESLSYTDSVTFSTLGSSFAVPRQAYSTLRYWNEASLKALPAESYAGAPSVFPGHCIATYRIAIADLDFDTFNPDQQNPRIGALQGIDLIVKSTSISFRPLYGGEEERSCGSKYIVWSIT
jgi:hypothetical protein